MKHDVSTYLDANLTEAQALAIVTLVNSVWPTPDKALTELVQELRGSGREMAAIGSEKTSEARLHFVVWEEDRAIAHAVTFPREISTPRAALSAMGLASVCVDPDRRGQGLGAAVARSAFQLVDGGSFPLSLFQTGVPGFYIKLGARTVTNRFVNSANAADPERNPWWEKYVMIYPAHYAWPEGTVDLNGPGY
jgi:predicted N-acetyltransferase YhbS